MWGLATGKDKSLLDLEWINQRSLGYARLLSSRRTESDLAVSFNKKSESCPRQCDAAFYPCYYRESMRRRRTRSRKLSLVAWWCVVVSLLFSVGEGLKLTPFSSAYSKSEACHFLASSNLKPAVFAHGPIDVPVQFRKREKRDFNDLALPANAGLEGSLTRKTPASALQKLTLSKLTTRAALGRAPPAVS